ncbi:MAG: sensor histidine kinase [Intestinimonas butyriciproducens]|uniref:sensor histidine kinase n=1 Tax=Intestinimonas butyriciproducens TaxID=1297617 RepID=UPI0039927D73
MAEFYRISGWLLICLSMLTAFCIVFQALAVTFSFRRLPGGWMRWSENLLEIGVLLHLFLCAALIAHVQYNALHGFLLPSSYGAVRQAVFFFVAILSVFVAVGLEVMWPFGVAVAAAILLPAVEWLSGSSYPMLFVAGILFCLIRSIHICLLRRRELHTQISAGSVKEAIDGLNAGLLFCYPNGESLLSNRRMEQLIQCCTGSYSRNGEDFFRTIQSGNLAGGCARETLGGQTAIRLPDGTAWLFRRYELLVGRRRCFLISAADMTEQWAADQALYRKNQELAQRGEDLRQTIENLRAACETEELLRGKARIHDTLGQRISLLLRAMRENKEPDDALLSAFAQGLPRNFWEDEAQSPGRRLELLTDMFCGMGVEVLIWGDLPQREAVAQDFADIAVECVTNAVRHGYATQVQFHFFENDCWRMSVTDNGIPPSSPVKEGGGLREMRRRVARLGGDITIHHTPRFNIQISVPKGEYPV